MSELAESYATLRAGGTSHADAIDLLVRSSGLDRGTLRRALERQGVHPRPPAPSRDIELAARRPRAKDRRRADRERAAARRISPAMAQGRNQTNGKR